MIDHNAFVGEWPFYKLPRHTLPELIELHKKHGITGGFVSSVKSIFYNDFYESEYELYEILKDTPYRQVVTVNPAMVECPLTLERCIREFAPAGIRIHPGFHGYNINSEILEPVLSIARERGLPLFVTGRMSDERLTHMIHPALITKDDLAQFIKKNSDLRIVLCHFKMDEIMAIKDLLLESSCIVTDISGFRGNLFGNSPTYIFSKAVFGSGYPLYPVAAPALMVKTELPEDILSDFIKRTV